MPPRPSLELLVWKWFALNQLLGATLGELRPHYWWTQRLQSLLGGWGWHAAHEAPGPRKSSRVCMASLGPWQSGTEECTQFIGTICKIPQSTSPTWFLALEYRIRGVFLKFNHRFLIKTSKVNLMDVHLQQKRWKHWKSIVKVPCPHKVISHFY